ncbi:MAG: DUF4350 domain-containing protein [Moorea sp. SIO1G6]|uniref:DUF4350 domain-containing protein n=1 Tax=Moorena sp. SIO1G6 TaxID=2607840 RepID=UPI0013C001B6|nr:DUF4350 domain-containing protein [Moorena sp. SIO1G6]NET66064.1 DUF4350 domain-containing protein [Moorena sp. SIO1G6]
MKFPKRRLGVISAIAIVVLMMITLVAAPANNKINSGSTYSRAPYGYGAWYAYMAKRGTPVQRWQKPFEDLANQTDAQGSVTLLRVTSWLTVDAIYGKEREWIKQGNRMVILGVKQPVTDAAFSTLQEASTGKVKVNTRRRYKGNQGKKILSDRFGAVVWEKPIGDGRVIFATTSDLAANAYQDFPANYELLAQLVTPLKAEGNLTNQNPVWVDEYLHGYKDVDVIKREVGETLFSYLAKTPLLPAFIQGLIILLVAIWALNRRFGQPLTRSEPVVDNSEAYIRALAGVLQKAGSTEFVLEVVGKDEQLQLQKALGLGQTLLEEQALIDAWVEQTGRPATELKQLLEIQSSKRRIRESDLLKWLGKWQKIRID